MCGPPLEGVLFGLRQIRANHGPPKAGTNGRGTRAIVRGRPGKKMPRLVRVYRMNLCRQPRCSGVFAVGPRPPHRFLRQLVFPGCANRRLISASPPWDYYASRKSSSKSTGKMKNRLGVSALLDCDFCKVRPSRSFGHPDAPSLAVARSGVELGSLSSHAGAWPRDEASG